MIKHLLLSGLLCLLAATTATAASTQIDTIHVATTYIESPMVVTVVTPSGYSPSCCGKTYPVVYLLNGYSGDYTSYATGMPVDSLANRFQVIFVCPDGRNSWYWDSPVVKNMQMESFIINDLVPTIDRRFATRPSREYRAIAGLSMGGHGSMWLALRHKDIFANAGSMSGGLNIAEPVFKDNWEMKRWLGPLEENAERWKSHSALSLIPTLNPGEMNIIVTCGSEDFFIGVNRNFDEALTARNIAHQFVVSPGSHTWEYWNAALPKILSFFAYHFQTLD